MSQIPIVRLAETSPPIIHLFNADPDLTRVIRLVMIYREGATSGYSDCLKNTENH